MLLVGSEGDQVAIENEGRHLIANRFFRVRRRSSNRVPYPSEDLLNISWEARDVFVDTPGRCSTGWHVGSFVATGKTADPPSGLHGLPKNTPAQNRTSSRCPSGGRLALACTPEGCDGPGASRPRAASPEGANGVLGRDDVRLGQVSLAGQPYGHLSRVLCGEPPGGSGNPPPILAHSCRQGILHLSARQPGQSKTQHPLAPPATPSRCPSGRAGVRSACTVPQAHVGRCPGALPGLQRILGRRSWSSTAGPQTATSPRRLCGLPSGDEAHRALRKWLKSHARSSLRTINRSLRCR
jgi:hypothetical protein